MFVSTPWLQGSQGVRWQDVIDSYVGAFGAELLPGLQRVMLCENDHGWLVLKFFENWKGSTPIPVQLGRGTELPTRGGTRLQALDEYKVVFDTDVGS